jgi:P4 family phage/plasmid primase-like protien
LFKDCLGDYGGTISVSIFTKGRLDANAPSPAVAKLKGKRFVDLQEPEGDDKLHMGIIKQWVGGDTVQGRELNKAPIEFVMKAKFVLVCNDLPTIDSLDGGTWRRIRLLEFLSKFVDNPKKSNEFKIDRKLKDKMENWHEMFMWLLIQYHRRYKQSGIKEPPAVTRVTDEYKENSDFYSQFFNEHMEKDLNAKISVKDAYKYFKIWHKSTYEGKKLVLRQNFEKHMSMLMGKPKGSYWMGYQYVSPEDREEDDDDDIKVAGKCNIESDAEDNNELYTNKIEYEIINESDIDSDSNSEAEVKVVKKVKKNTESSKPTKAIKSNGKKKKKTIIYYDSDSDSDSDSE